MPNDAHLGPYQEKIRRLANEMIEKFGKAALDEATQRKNSYESCGLSSEASTWGIVCTKIQRIDVRVQSWWIDPGVVQGVAASNAIGAQGP